MWAAFGLAIGVFGGAERWSALEAGVSAVAAGIAIFEVLKRLTGRRRPCDIEPHCWAELLPPDRFSFPSGHSMTAFAVTVTLAAFYPVLLGLLLVCAASVAVSRVLLGMHFVSDVVAGSILGGLVGYAAVRWIA